MAREAEAVPGPTSNFWTDPKTQFLWRYHIEWGKFGDRWEPISFKVEPLENPDPVPITAETLRRFPFGTMVAKARANQRAGMEKASRNRDSYRAKDRRGFAKLAEQFGTQRGTELSGELLEEVARVYREAFQRGEPVVLAVADAFKISRSSAAKRIAAARRANKLGPAVGPRAGEATTKTKKGAKR